MKDLLAELRRRNVIRVAVGYAAAAWLLLQIVTTTLPAFDAPGWITRAVIIALIIGFPVALTLAWVFELTADGLQRDSEVDRTSVTHSHSSRVFDRIVIISGLVNGSAWLTRATGAVMARYQSGSVRTYALLFVAGVAALLALNL